MTKAATQKRLEGLQGSCIDTLDQAMQREKTYHCRACKEPNIVSIPDSVAVRASVAVLDRTGHGPTQKIQPVAPEREGVEGLAEELCLLPYETRVAVVIRMLPEHELEFEKLGWRRISLVGSAQADGTS